MLKLKKYVIASVVSILIAVLVHVAYDVASAMNTFEKLAVRTALLTSFHPVCEW